MSIKAYPENDEVKLLNEHRKKEDKVIKVIRILGDDNEEYLEGESLENFLKFESSAYAIAMSHGLKQDEVKWKKKLQLKN